MKPTGTKIETRTVTMSHENVVAAIASFLYATRTIPESWDITFLDLGLPVNEEGFVEFEIEIAKSINRPKLQVVDENYIGDQDNEQLELKLETFEKIHVE